MNARVDHILGKALALDPEDRSALALALLDSLEVEDESSVAKAWAAEISARRESLRSGATTAVPWSEAKNRLNAL